MRVVNDEPTSDRRRAAPRKRYGQNFLQDPNVAQRIVDACGIRQGDRVLEIGPGRGALTGLLAEKSEQLYAVEVDRDLAAQLRERFPGMQLREANVLRVDFDELLIGDDWIVIGNLPYNISTPLLIRLLPFVSRCRSLIFMLQQEVVERMVAAVNTKEYGRLTVILGYYCVAEPLLSVSPQSFFPVPKVKSRVVRLQPRKVAPPPPRFSEIVRRAFSQRRKTLRNALSGVLDSAELISLDIDPMRRAETLSVADFVRIAQLAPNDRAEIYLEEDDDSFASSGP